MKRLIIRRRIKMVTNKDIFDMYAHLRKTNTSIPDEVLDFMKDVCLKELSGEKEIYVCTDFELSYNDMRMRNKNIERKPNGSIFIIEISSR
jgi:hypothetical protein